MLTDLTRAQETSQSKMFSLLTCLTHRSHFTGLITPGDIYLNRDIIVQNKNTFLTMAHSKLPLQKYIIFLASIPQFPSPHAIFLPYFFCPFCAYFNLQFSPNIGRYPPPPKKKLRYQPALLIKCRSRLFWYRSGSHLSLRLRILMYEDQKLHYI